MAEDWTGPLPAGWTGGESVTKWWRGKHMHLYSVRKPCAQCQREMKISVSGAALEGKAKNAGLHLTRCTECRTFAKLLPKTSSRPKIENETPQRKLQILTEAVEAIPADAIELADLRAMNETMKAELSGLYKQNRELREKLSRYEPTPAMEAVANGHRMPWEL